MLDQARHNFLQTRVRRACKPSYDLVRNVMLIQILHIAPLSEVDAPRVPEGPLHNSCDRLKYFGHMSSRHLLVSKFLFSVYKFVRVFNKKSFTPLRGEQILCDRTDFSNEPMLSALCSRVCRSFSLRPIRHFVSQGTAPYYVIAG